MWPFDLPAHEALRLSRQTAPAWAVFDAAWYRTTYADVVGALLDGPDDALLGYYLDMGQASGHSPNRYFDEAWHLRTYSGIKVLVDAGAFASAFDSY